MQTTLLGLAVAIILALVTALVGPFFVDWGRYRSAFETEASRLVGMPVRVHGAIDARLLPTPSLLLKGIEIGGNDARRVSAKSLAVEFSLGPLMRGEWRAAELRVDGPQFAVGLDRTGHIDAPALAVGFDPDQLTIERLLIENGHAVLADAASGGTLVLDNLSFRGELRSLLGPFHGEGGFALGGEHYGYQVAGSRRSPDGGTKLRLAINPAERPLIIETEGTLWADGAGPRYDGSLTLSRPVGTVLASGKAVASEPWRATARVKANAADALLEQIEIQYGPEDRVTRLAGTADVKFGAKPRLDGVISARQADIDRLLGPSDGTRRPIAALQTFIAGAAGGIRFPLPVKLGLDVDAVTIGGAAVQSVRGDLHTEADGWIVDTFEFRAPGLSQVRLSGRLNVAGESVAFTGPVSVDAGDPKGLFAWLEGRSEGRREALGPLRARGDVTIGGERIAVDRLKAELDRKTLEGRIAYVFATGDRRARIEAALTAPELDLDGVSAFATGALAGSTLERPGEIALALSIGKATFAGVDANRAEVDLRYDQTGLQIQRMIVSDFRGASLTATGRIDTSSSSPSGAVSVALDAQRLDGLAALAGSLAPGAGDLMRRYAAQLGPAKVNARFEVEPAKGQPGTAARLALDGRLGAARLHVTATGTGESAALAAANLHMDGTVEADDGSVIAALSGADRYFALDKRPVALSLTADGTSGNLGVDARLASGGLWANASGSVRLSKEGPDGAFDLSLSAADARGLHGEGAVPVPLAAKTRLTFAGRDLKFTDLSGRIAGASFAGGLTATLGSPAQVEGRISAEDVDAAAVAAVLIGMPSRSKDRAASSAGMAEPFGAGVASGLSGRVSWELKRAAVAPGLAADELRGIARFSPGGIAFEDVSGIVAGGRLDAAAEFHTEAAGLRTELRATLKNADIAALSGGKGPVSGRLTIEAQGHGAGLSPATLLGALQGNGTVTAEDVQIAGLDPGAIDAAIRAGERGLPLERVADFVTRALDGGRLHVPWASAAVSIGDGRARIVNLAAPAESVDVLMSTSLDLVESAVDARFTLTGAAREDAVGGRRPELSVGFKGPWGSAKRSVDAAALANWVTLHAVEQEAKRLEAAEQEAKRLQALEAARRAERERQERERAERERQERERAAREQADRERAERERAQAATSSATSSAPASTSAAAVAPRERAPDLPPPIDIKPLPMRPHPRVPRAATPAPAPAPQTRAPLPLFPMQ